MAAAALSAGATSGHAAGYVGYIGSGSNQVPASVATGSYPTIVTTHTISPDDYANGAVFAEPYGRGAVALGIPGGALPVGTQVTLAAGDPASIQPTLSGPAADPTKTSIIASYAVAWTPVAGDAMKPIFLAVFDPLLNKTVDSLLTTGPDGSYLAAPATSAGFESVPIGSKLRDFAHFEFRSDPGFVVTGPNVLPTAASVPSGVVPAGPGRTGGLRGPSDQLPVGVGALVVGAGVAVSIRRRRRRQPLTLAAPL